WGDAPNLAVGELTRAAIKGRFREPEVAIGPSSDAASVVAGSGERELGDLPSWGDAPNPVDIVFREPQVAIGPSDDVARGAAGSRELDLALLGGWGDAPNLAVGELTRAVHGIAREPQVAIGSGGDAIRPGHAGGERELGDHACWLRGRWSGLACC